MPSWPAYDPAAHVTMELGERIGPISVAEPQKLQFFLARLKK